MEQAQRVARPREHRVTCSREEKEMSRDTVFDRSQPARTNRGPCAHLPRLAEPWHGGRVGAVVCGENDNDAEDITHFKAEGYGYRVNKLTIRLAHDLAKFCVPKGSVGVGPS